MVPSGHSEPSVLSEGHCSHESARIISGCHFSPNTSHHFKIPHCIPMGGRGNITLHLHVYAEISAVQVSACFLFLLTFMPISRIKDTEVELIKTFNCFSHHCQVRKQNMKKWLHWTAGMHRF